MILSNSNTCQSPFNQHILRLFLININVWKGNISFFLQHRTSQLSHTITVRMCLERFRLRTCCCGLLSARTGLIIVIGLRCLFWLGYLLLSHFGIKELNPERIKDLKQDDMFKEVIEGKTEKKPADGRKTVGAQSRRTNGLGPDGLSSNGLSSLGLSTH